MAKTYEIHPAIGIARLGRSPEHYFGPEPDGVFPPPIVPGPGGKPRSLRDASGELRPQAARFRVFEVERQGAQLVSAREVTAAEAVISWRVHVVNRKAAAPRFTAPGTSNRNTDPAMRRNGAKNTDDLDDPTNKPLIINAGVHLVDSTSANVVTLQGAFMGVPVTLGRIFTEAATGRLIFVGGTGVSDTVPGGQGLSPLGTDFADNDKWFDDTCDGSVEADLTFKADSQHEAVRLAWVISGPYDFAPEVTNLVTVYDVLYEVAVDTGLRAIPNPVFYDQHILPIFERLSGYQWVNARARAKHGVGNQFDFLGAAWSDLADPAAATGKAHRQRIFEHLSPPGSASAPKSPGMPLLHSDTFPHDDSVLWLTKVQFALLQA
jgi:hypothetical protein